MRANALNIDPVALPPHARLTTLDCLDYTDAFRLETERAQERSAEGGHADCWMRPRRRRG
jgi:hypothetical protein